MLQDTLHTDSVPFPAQEMPVADSTAHLPVYSFVEEAMRAPVDSVSGDSVAEVPRLVSDSFTAKPDRLEAFCRKDLLAAFPHNEFTRGIEAASGRSYTVTVPFRKGMSGDPTPYQFKNDNFVTIMLMLSFFLVVWVISRSRRFLSTEIKDFFHQRKSNNYFSEDAEKELRGQTFLVFQTCFVLGLLFFDWTQEKQVDVFLEVSPYKILGVSVAIFCLYYVLKIACYQFVNSIFFDRTHNEQWIDTYLLSILTLGVTLLPVVLLVVYFDLEFEKLTTLFISILIIDKILLLYKCSRIFFNHTLGWVHLFLYFCTLEIMPILILFRALIYANRFLLTIN